MFTIDTNLLVYTHNSLSPFHQASKQFIFEVLNGLHGEVGITTQAFVEFIHVVTSKRF